MVMLVELGIWVILMLLHLTPFSGSIIAKSTESWHCGKLLILMSMYPQVLITKVLAAFWSCLLMEGTFVLPPDDSPNAIDQNTPLEPFRKSSDAFFTSIDCQSTSTYGYTYPEIAAAIAAGQSSKSQ